MGWFDKNLSPVTVALTVVVRSVELRKSSQDNDAIKYFVETFTGFVLIEKIYINLIHLQGGILKFF
jgi:hypothetical protein